MSIRRLVGTALAMALVAAALGALTPDLAVMAGHLAASQRTVDTAGADALVVSAAGLVAWAAWAWGAAGLALTAASALPGLAGAVARAVLSVVVPAAARRSAALALGVGLGMSGPVLGATSVLVAAPASAVVPVLSAGDVPDWPAALPVAHPEPSVPDWPTGERSGRAHVVVRGDCLWHIATARLAEGQAAPPTDAEIAAEVHAWWAANADVIGPDPDLLLPGQVLRPPAAP
jgi:nucleoid-associated protein YgaU